MAGGIFKRLSAGRPPAEKANSDAQKLQHAQKVLNWLQRWDKPTVSSKDMRVYGPRPRDREAAARAAEILVERGWLTPIQTRQYNAHAWRIIRKPIVHPTVTGNR